MKTTIYSMEGKSAGSFELPESLFALPWNASLMHEVVTAMRDNARTPVAHTKNRGEVRGGGRKPWQQKGTGRARHGSIRSPIWKGGGITHGPRNEKDYSRKVNRKARAKALFIALSQKFRDGEMLFVDALHFEKPATTLAIKTLGALAKVEGFETLVTKRKNSALIVVPDASLALMRSFSNLGNVEIISTSALNPVVVLQYKNVLIISPEKALEIFGTRKLGTAIPVTIEADTDAAPVAAVKKAVKKVAAKKVAVAKVAKKAVKKVAKK
jgi:large subunit ribosomal protein L4